MSDEVDRLSLGEAAKLARAFIALERMSPRTFRVFVSSQVEGRRYAEIARRECMTIGQVRRHMRRAIAIIAKHMAD